MACDEAVPESGLQPLANAAQGAESISNRHFSRVTVPCDDPETTARSLLELTRRDLEEDMRVELLDHGIDAVQLKDGSGRIAVIVYSVSAADSQTSVTTTEHFLINNECRVMHWSSAVNPSD